MITGFRIFAAIGLAEAMLAAPQGNIAEASTLRVAVNASDVANLDSHRATDQPAVAKGPLWVTKQRSNRP